MDKRHLNARNGLAAVAVAGALVTLSVGGAATASGADAGAAASPATITMKFEKGKFSFKGAKTVRRGAKLRIRNDTNPRSGGPHTFSLVRKRLLPGTPKEQKQCFAGNICLKLAMAHEFDEETGKVGKSLVRVGKRGWDRQFTASRRGDTWYSETDGETFSQKVSARAGRTLYYMCVVHPEMQGKIKVVGRR